MAQSASLATPHLHTFPPAIAHLAAAFNVRRLELTLAQGRWADGDPLPPRELGPLPPPGLELRVQFCAGARDTQRAFSGLAGALAPLLCPVASSAPELALLAAPRVGWFAGEGVAAPPGQQVQVYLPQQALCTNSLAAWQRLAPCGARAGLAAALSAEAFAAAPFRWLGLQLLRSEGGNGTCGSRLELRQTLTAALETAPTSGGDLSRQLAWPPLSCPATEPTSVVLPLPEGKPAAAGCRQVDTPLGPLQACDPGSMPRLAVPTASAMALPAPPQLQVASHVVQLSSHRGELVLAARVQLGGGNASAAGAPPALLHVMQLVPWQLPVQEGSLRLEVDGQLVLPAPGPLLAWASLPLASQSMRRPAALELLLRLPQAVAVAAQQPQQHEVRVRLAFTKAFVGVFDQPPDASRGVDVPPALVTLVPPACAAERRMAGGGHGGGSSDSSSPSLLQRLERQRGGSACAGLEQARGRPGVVPLPIPDASMPFNVICFTSTLLAVYFGGLANKLLR